MSAVSSPICAQRRSSAASRRGAQSAISQRTSSAAVKWIVPRISHVRTICRSSMARSTPRAEAWSTRAPIAQSDWL